MTGSTDVALTLAQLQAVKAEKTTVANMVTTLQTADQTLQSNIDSEKKNRETADQTLQSKIDSLETALDLKENKSDTFTYMVSVNDTEDKYLIDGESQPSLDLFNGNTYIFDMSSSIPENFINFSTTPNGPIEYTEGVTSTEVLGKVETTMTFSDLLFNGVNESLQRIELKSINNFPQVPDILNRNNRLYYRVPSSVCVIL